MALPAGPVSVRPALCSVPNPNPVPGTLHRKRGKQSEKPPPTLVSKSPMARTKEVLEKGKRKYEAEKLLKANESSKDKPKLLQKESPKEKKKKDKKNKKEKKEKKENDQEIRKMIREIESSLDELESRAEEKKQTIAAKGTGGSPKNQVI